MPARALLITASWLAFSPALYYAGAPFRAQFQRRLQDTLSSNTRHYHY